jgi:hypothetical protein
MLSVLDSLPEGFLDASAGGLHQVLCGPSLIHLPGRHPRPLFVSVLLHGNEDTGLNAAQAVLARYQDRELPRALSLFVGNVQAAAVGQRHLDGQPDYNRVWPGADTMGLPEHAMMQQVVAAMRAKQVFASIDFHNNTGLNPHYACVSRLDQPFLHFATLFSRTVVYFRRPLGVQTAAFAGLCPSVTVECGKAGSAGGEEHAGRFLEAALHLDHFPPHAVAGHDIDLYHTVGTVKVPEAVSFSFTSAGADVQFDRALDHMNFRDVETGTHFADVAAHCRTPVTVWDEDGSEVTDRYFTLVDGQLRTARPVTPSMLTLNERVIRQDCLCYLMERLPYP